MANAQIYRKTIDPSIQGGIDQSLILDPNAFYQRKFSFGNDWTEIKVGMFLSYTNSVTNNNLNFTSGQADVSSGALSNDTFTYWGIIEDKPIKYLPNTSGSLPEGGFIGARFDHLSRINSTWAYNNNQCNGGIGGYGSQGIISNTDKTHIVNAGFSTSWRSSIPLTRTDNTALFASYFSIKYTLLDGGTPTQKIRIQSHTLFDRYTDISLVNLKLLINTDTINRNNNFNYDFDWNNSVNALPLPDSFFFYNAFLTVRPRIHAIAVKKIS